MSVEVIMTGRLGNNLFQYAIGRIIAEHHRFELNCEPPKRSVLAFMGRELDIGLSATLDGLQDLFPNAPLHITGRRSEIPFENFDMHTDGLWNSHTIDLDGLLANPTPRKIRLLGNFQRYQYLEPFQDSIRHWFDFRSPPCPYEVRPKDVVLNIRRGFDFWLHDATLSMSYYHHALGQLRDVGAVYICGTGLDDQVRSSLSEYSPVYYDATPAEHFGFIKRFDRIILSNSTFAWWAAFLSNATEILGPRSTGGCRIGLSGVGDVDLNMNEPRYYEIDVTSRAEPALTVSTNVAAVKPGGDNTMLVHFTDRAPTSISSLLGDNEWLEQHVQQREPLYVAELRKRFRGAHGGLPSFLAQLVSSGFISKEPIYIDEGASH